MAKKRNGTVYVPPLPPASAVSSSMGLQDLVAQWRMLQATLKLQTASTKGAYKQAKVDISDALSQNLVDVEAGSIERGTTGSSTDLEQRIGVRGQAARALADASAARAQGLGALTLEKQLGQSQLQTGLANWQAGRAAEQSSMAVDEFASGTMPGTGVAAGGASPGGGSGGVTLTEEIDRLVQRLEQNPGRSVPIEERLYQLWRQRNQALRRSGQKPQPMSQLVAMIRAAKGGDMMMTGRREAGTGFTTQGTGGGGTGGGVG